MSNREKKPSPFPQAYKVLVDLENDREITERFNVSEDLLAACKARDGVFCSFCGIGDPTGLDWEMEQSIDDEGTPVNYWTCKLCVKTKNSGKDKDPTDYTYSSTTLDTSVEEIKLPKPRVKFRKKK